MGQYESFSRRRLPHWYVPGAAHFVTYRLAETIPVAVLEQLRAERNSLLKPQPRERSQLAEFRQRVHKQMFAKYDHYLDFECSIDWLRDPRVASIVRGNFYHHHGSKYHLLSYCVMPNHVHVLLQPIDKKSRRASCQLATGTSSRKASNLVPPPEDWISDERPDADSPLASVMHSLKSYSANRANEVLSRQGQFWQHESYDHWVRDEDELERIVDYISWNPVKAKLVQRPHDWYFSSAHDRYLQDGERTGWLSHR